MQIGTGKEETGREERGHGRGRGSGKDRYETGQRERTNGERKSERRVFHWSVSPVQMLTGEAGEKKKLETGITAREGETNKDGHKEKVPTNTEKEES